MARALGILLAALVLMSGLAGAAPPKAVSLPSQPERPHRVVLLGDSVAASAADALTAEAARRGIELVAYARVGCGLTTGVPVGTNNASFSTSCAQTTPQLLDAAARNRVDAVLWMSSWEINSHVVDGRTLAFRTPEWDAWFASEIDAVRTRYGVPLLIVNVAPRAPLGPISTMTQSEAADVARFNDFLASYVANHPTTSGLVDAARILCPDACPEYFGEVRPRPDLGAHFDAAGAAWFAPQLLDSLQRSWERVGELATAPDGLF